MNENVRKEFEQPTMKVVVIDSADIIATSAGDGRGDDGNTGGTIPDAPFE